MINLAHCFVAQKMPVNPPPPQETKIRVDVEYSGGAGLMC